MAMGEGDDGRFSPEARLSREIIVHAVRPLLFWVEKPEVEEVVVNRPGEVWLKLRKPDARGDLWTPREDPAFTRASMELMLHVLANSNQTPRFGPAGNPVTTGTLPGGHRYAGAYGYNVQYYSGEVDPKGTAIIACRQSRPESKMSLSDYGLEKGVALMPYDLVDQRKSDGSDPHTRLLNSLSRGDHILVSGGMGSGKTTFLNNLAERMSHRLRIITVQDSSELHLSQPNHVHILMPREGAVNEFSYRGVVDLIKRQTPDVIMAGEVSSTNAGTIWELMRSGHGHFMTTIHAESAEEAVSTLMTNIGHSAPAEVQDPERLRDDITRKVRVVQLARNPHTNERRIVQIT